jgi:PadR family transcriptional regulator, regulatory protein PadR
VAKPIEKKAQPFDRLGVYACDRNHSYFFVGIIKTYKYVFYSNTINSSLSFDYRSQWKPNMDKKNKKEELVKLSAIDEDVLTVFGGRELYGLEILDELNLGRPIELGFGSLYPALNRLEKKGLIAWRWGDEEEVSGGARRKYYKMTSLGATTLLEVQQYRHSLAARAAQGYSC